MLIATIGGLIKDYRIKKRLSQEEISLAIGWKEATRLSKIEQGRVKKPSREIIEKIITALRLNEHEKGHFLLTGGYLPTDDEVKSVIKNTSKKIDNWKYPAYLMDFSFRWLYTNTATLKIVNYPSSQKNWIQKEKPNFLEFPFFSKEQLPVDIMKGEDAENLKDFKIAQIATFKTENANYEQEDWYKKLILSLMKYEEFRKLWFEVDQGMYHKKLFDYEYKRITGIYGNKKNSLNFHLTTARLISDQRFQVVLYYPADNITFNFFK